MTRDRRLIVATLVFVILAAIPWVLPLNPPAPETGSLSATADPRDIPTLPPYDTLGESLRRPLFTAARRAAPTTASGQVAPDGTTIGRYRLTGVVITGNQKFVMLRESNGGRVLRVPEGGEIEGWTVKSIAQDRVLLGSASGEHSVNLGQNRAPSR